LTEREFEIAKLVAQALSNRVIADELYISVKTVHMHLSNIWGKLDVPVDVHKRMWLAKYVGACWQTEWPTESGVYWFYGWCWEKHSARERVEEPEMHLVSVRVMSNGVSCVTNGHFLYKAEGAEGMWLKAELPEPPREIKGCSERDGRVDCEGLPGSRLD